MAMIVDNPAARLFSILKAGKTQDNNAVCRTVWQSLLHVPEGNEPQLLARLAGVMELTQIIAVEMNTHYPDENGMVAYWRNQVDKAFKDLNLNNTWNHFSSAIDLHAMNYLSTTSKLMQVVTKLKPVAEGDLAGLREKIDTLIVETRESDIDEDLKLNVIRYLNRLLQSIDEYFITGVTPILDSINTAYGSAFTDPKYREFITGSSTLGEKVRSLLSDVALVTTVAANLHDIAPVLTAGWKLLTGTA